MVPLGLGPCRPPCPQERAPHLESEAPGRVWSGRQGHGPQTVGNRTAVAEEALGVRGMAHRPWVTGPLLPRKPWASGAWPTDRG